MTDVAELKSRVGYDAKSADPESTCSKCNAAVESDTPLRKRLRCGIHHFAVALKGHCPDFDRG